MCTAPNFVNVHANNAIALWTGAGFTAGNLTLGVAEDDRDRLFGRFVRGAERSPGEGRGFGLYVPRELCRAMRGDLQVEPPFAGAGAALSVHLPGESPLES